jgi:phospholipase/carboxylesterase
MAILKTCEYGNLINPKNLVILLHGYGSNARNLIDLAEEFQPIIPDSLFIAPNAIEPWEGGFVDSYQWFSLKAGVSNNNIENLSSSIKNSNKILQKFILEQLTKFNLAFENLILMGFSQGSMMSIYQGLTLPKKIRCVISFSGKIVQPEMVGDKIISKPDICLIHGNKDSVLPFNNFLEAKEILTKESIPFSSFEIHNMDHTINFQAIKNAQDFIKKFY